LPQKEIAEKEEKTSLASRYLDFSRSKKKKDYLGQEKKRVENITADQAIQLSKQEQSSFEVSKSIEGRIADRENQPLEMSETALGSAAPLGKSVSEYDADAWFETADEISAPAPAVLGESIARQATGRDIQSSVFRVEVDPMQSVFVSDDKMVFFRRIVIDNRVYRQGFVLLIQPFLNHLAESHFTSQPMSKFSNLNMSIKDNGKSLTPEPRQKIRNFL